MYRAPPHGSALGELIASEEVNGIRHPESQPSWPILVVRLGELKAPATSQFRANRRLNLFSSPERASPSRLLFTATSLPV